MSTRLFNQGNAEPPFPSCTCSDADCDPLKKVDIRDSSKYSVFDKSAFLASLGGEEQMLALFLALFRKGVANQLASLCSAHVKGDVKKVRVHINAIMGACAGVSAKRMLNTAERMRNAVECGGISDSTKALLALLHVWFDEFNRTAGE